MQSWQDAACEEWQAMIPRLCPAFGRAREIGAQTLDRHRNGERRV